VKIALETKGAMCEDRRAGVGIRTSLGPPHLRYSGGGGSAHDYDPVALVVLVVGMSAVALLALSAWDRSEL
jgi:hypothetical protein